MTTEPEHTVVERFRMQSGLSVRDLWMRYFALGGAESAEHVESYLNGEAVLDETQYDVLAQALNERFLELGRTYPVPYRTT